MPATRSGGLKAAATNKRLYGRDFYQRVGALGGLKSRGGGFQYKSDMAAIAGRIGGKGGWSKLSQKERKQFEQEIADAKTYDFERKQAELKREWDEKI